MPIPHGPPLRLVRILAAVSVAALALSMSACSDGGKGDDPRSGSSSGATTSAGVATSIPTTSATSAPVVPVTAPTEPLIPPGVGAEPVGTDPPDGTYLAQVNSYDNENDTLNLNWVDIETGVITPEGKRYNVVDAEPASLTERPLAQGADLQLLPDSGGWQPQPVERRQEFYSAIGNRVDRPTPFDVRQDSVFVVTLSGGEYTMVHQLYLP